MGMPITLHDGLRAPELMAIAAGRLRPQHAHRHTFDHVAYLANLSPDEHAEE